MARYFIVVPIDLIPLPGMTISLRMRILV